MSEPIVPIDVLVAELRAIRSIPCLAAADRLEQLAAELAGLATDAVTRFEVIDHTTNGKGRCLVRYGVRVEPMLQDGGRTLKMRLLDPPA